MNEIWKPIKEYEGLYEASNLGRIRTSRHSRAGLIMKFMTSHGYKRIGLRSNGKQKPFPVHRLIWEAFKAPIPDGLQINHINGDKGDNRLENLEVVTPSQNRLHAVHVLGKKPPRVFGENHPRAKLTLAKIETARSMRREGHSQKEIAQSLGVDPSTISNLFRGKSWCDQLSADALT